MSVYVEMRGAMLALVNDSARTFGVQSVAVVALPKWDKAYALR